jgi:hypothetical protein
MYSIKHLSKIIRPSAHPSPLVLPYRDKSVIIVSTTIWQGVQRHHLLRNQPSYLTGCSKYEKTLKVVKITIYWITIAVF